MTTTNFSNTSDDSAVVSTSVVSEWVTLIMPTALDDQDASGNPVDPDALPSTTHPRLRRGTRDGIFMSVRALYDINTTPSADAVLRVWGRKAEVVGANGTVLVAAGTWQALYNVSGVLNITLTTAATDCYAGLLGATQLLATSPSPLLHRIDCEGCNEFTSGVVTAFAGSGGSLVFAHAQAKFY